MNKCHYNDITSREEQQIQNYFGKEWKILYRYFDFCRNQKEEDGATIAKEEFTNELPCDTTRQIAIMIKPQSMFNEELETTKNKNGEHVHVCIVKGCKLISRRKTLHLCYKHIQILNDAKTIVHENSLPMFCCEGGCNNRIYCSSRDHRIASHKQHQYCLKHYKKNIDNGNTKRTRKRRRNNTTNR